jgi:hypothetical protein
MMKAVLGCFGDYDPAQNFCKYECPMVQGCKVWTNYLSMPLSLWSLACRKLATGNARIRWVRRAKL